MYDGIVVAIRVIPSFGHPARLVLTAESGNTGVGQEFPAPVLFMSFYTVSQHTVSQPGFGVSAVFRTRGPGSDGLSPNGPFFIRKGLASARISPKPGFSASGLHHRVNLSRQPLVCQTLPDSLPNCEPPAPDLTPPGSQFSSSHRAGGTRFLRPRGPLYRRLLH